MNSQSLIEQYLLGNLDDDQVKQLEQLLTDDAELRREFALSAMTDAALRETALQRSVGVSEATGTNGSTKLWWAMLAGLAAVFLLAVSLSGLLSRSSSIATLVSSENAAWESSLPTTPGSALDPGLLSLKSGVATIRFDSGAELVLEAPAELQLLTSMRGRMLSGAAVVEVPDSAIGFVIETPDGYVVDYGTQFAVRVNQLEQNSNFELIEGEIAVHHPPSGGEVRLKESGNIARIADQSLAMIDPESNDDEDSTAPATVIRLATEGRTKSAIRINKFGKYLDREVLSVKTTGRQKWDQRSFFAFDLSSVDLESVQSVRLRLNLVPSTRGFASSLPKINRFAVYAVASSPSLNWNVDWPWEESPQPDDGSLVGKFEVLRSQQRGSFSIESNELLAFLKQSSNRTVTMILLRETTQRKGDGPGLTHTFASDFHPESVGPLLEFTTR